MLAGVRRSTAATVAAAIAVALVAGWHTAATVQSAEAAAARYGDTTAVLVMQRSVRAGEVVSAADVETRRLPRALLPHAAVAGQAVGRVATVDLVAGEVVLAARVGTTLVPAGWRAVAVTPPGSGAHPPVVAGDAVEVIDVGGEGGALVAEEALVVGVDREGTVTVAVPSDAVAAVAYAAAGGTAALAVIAPRPRR